MFGYKHTLKAIQKMKARFINPLNHPMFGKTHSIESRNLISKPGALNPMFGKTQKTESRLKISNKLSKPVSLYNINNIYLLRFKSNTLSFGA